MPESFNLLVERLKQLPTASGEVWQGGWVRLPAWIRDEEAGGEPFRPAAAFWSVPRRQLHMSKPMAPAKATPEILLRTAAEFAEGKLIGGHRPEALEVKDATLAEDHHVRWAVPALPCRSASSWLPWAGRSRI